MTTKVTKTEPYKDSQVDAIVCKGKLVFQYVPAINSDDIKNYSLVGKGLIKPIIIFEAEEIESNNWYLHHNIQLNNYSLFKADSKFNEFNNPNIIDKREFVLPYKNYKVLALPENFSPKQLQAIIDGKLKDGDEVFVECEYITYDDNGKSGKVIRSRGYHQIRLNKDNHIKLFPVRKEEKMYSKQEVFVLLEECASQFFDINNLKQYKGGVQGWFEDNEEKLKDLLPLRFNIIEESWEEIINRTIKETDNGNLLFYKNYFNNNFNPPTRKKLI